MITIALLAVLLARCLMPSIGVLFLGWDPGRVLVILFLDTMLAIGMLIVATAFSLSQSGTQGRPFLRAKALFVSVVAAAFLVAVLAIPLGGALFFMLVGTDFSLRFLLADPSFRSSAAFQALMSIGWGVSLLWRLRKQTPEQVGLKPLFALTILRWVVLIFVTYTGLARVLGHLGPYLLVLVYSGTMIFSELNPRRFLQILPGLDRPSTRRNRISR